MSGKKGASFADKVYIHSNISGIGMAMRNEIFMDEGSFAYFEKRVLTKEINMS
ncbi:hypothetical protein [Paenibacillus konkukensis]|uniref:hypothetical protein n=1 Tax=Paenibacillus konkukensis TaxID=2020716 RepID=UPI00201E0303|nr:hypothetical protein [Paenibacillus konkukensis]